jgi:hypothetical protein
MKITAVVPIRKGSQRVKDKNLRPFANTTLLDNKLKTLLTVPEFDSIIVNTNSEAAIELVEEEYNNTKITYHRREEYYASSQCSGSDFFKHLGEVTDTDIFVYTPCTSPFIKAETYSRCIQKFLESQQYDSLATVSLVKEFLWLKGEALNYDPAHAPNSQNLPDIYALNFGVTVIHKNNLIKYSNIIGHNPQFVVTEDIEAIDIDTPLDFYIAEQIYKKKFIQHKDLLDY